jgi:hypothetical protein
LTKRAVIDAAKRSLASVGVVLAYDRELNEYRVNFRNGNEASAAYTGHLDDAIRTGLAMARWRENH